MCVCVCVCVQHEGRGASTTRPRAGPAGASEGQIYVVSLFDEDALYGMSDYLGYAAVSVSSSDGERTPCPGHVLDTSTTCPRAVRRRAHGRHRGRVWPRQAHRLHREPAGEPRKVRVWPDAGRADGALRRGLLGQVRRQGRALPLLLRPPWRVLPRRPPGGGLPGPGLAGARRGGLHGRLVRLKPPLLRVSGLDRAGDLGGARGVGVERERALWLDLRGARHSRDTAEAPPHCTLQPLARCRPAPAPRPEPLPEPLPPPRLWHTHTPLRSGRCRSRRERAGPMPWRAAAI